MTTRSGLRTTIRTELNDSGGTQLWTDGELNQWIGEALDDYAEHFPKPTGTSISAVAAQEDYNLPADCWRVERVEHPDGFFRVLDHLSAGDRVDPFGTSVGIPKVVTEQLSYEVWGPLGAMVLSLRPAPTDAADAIVVRYWAIWAKPSADGDTLTIPTHDDRLLVLFVANRAMQRLGTDESKRQRWERTRGATAQGAARQYEGDYNAAIRLRKRRVRPGRLAVREG